MNQQTSHRQQVSFCKNVDDTSHRIVGIGDKKQRPIVLCYVVPQANPKMACDTTTQGGIPYQTGRSGELYT